MPFIPHIWYLLTDQQGKSGSHVVFANADRELVRTIVRIAENSEALRGTLAANRTSYRPFPHSRGFVEIKPSPERTSRAIIASSPARVNVNTGTYRTQICGSAREWGDFHNVGSPAFCGKLLTAEIEW
jgi:hypothetical protein